MCGYTCIDHIINNKYKGPRTKRSNFVYAN